MATMRITVPSDRKVIIQLPEDIPVGTDLEVTVNPVQANGNEAPVKLTLEMVRAKLAAAGKLGTAFMPPDDMVVPTEEEFLAAAERASAGPSIREIMDEMRGRK